MTDRTITIDRNIVSSISGDTYVNYYGTDAVSGFTLEFKGDKWVIRDGSTLEVCRTERDALLTYADFIEEFVGDMTGKVREMHEAEITRARADAEHLQA